MVKYLKIAVPDDFDEDAYDGYHIAGRSKYDEDILDLRVDFWKPQYKEVLDHGFVGLIDFMGDDNRIVQAARVSYGKGTQKKSTDEGLIRYLKRHSHTSPSEMVEFQFHLKAPIFVFRQLIRHRMANVNEYSARYSEMEDEMYFPKPEHMFPQSSTNKQGRSNEPLSPNNANAVITALEEIKESTYTTYEYLLGKPKMPDALVNRKHFIEEAALNAIKSLRDNGTIVTDAQINSYIKEYARTNNLDLFDDEFTGLARELARIVLPVAMYSQMYWKMDLHNLFHFIRLRSDSHAQYEIRVYSDAILDLIQPIVPMSVKAFMDYDMQGAKLSRMELETLQLVVDYYLNTKENGKTNLEDQLKESGASAREIKEFLTKLKV